MERGTEEDKANCPLPSARNQPHRTKRKVAHKTKTPSSRRRLGATMASGGSVPAPAAAPPTVPARKRGGTPASAAAAGTGNGSTGNGCEFENVPGGSACMYADNPNPPNLDGCQCTDKNCHPDGGCTRRFHHSCGAMHEESDERFSSLVMKKCCPQCMYKICKITWGGTAAPSAPAASGDGFMNDFHIDPERQSGLLNNISDFSRGFVDDGKALVREEMAERAAEAGVVPGGDGDGNPLIVRGGRKRRA